MSRAQKGRGLDFSIRASYRVEIYGILSNEDHTWNRPRQHPNHKSNTRRSHTERPYRGLKRDGGMLEFVQGGYQFTKIVLRPTIAVTSAEAVDQVKHALEDAHKNCLVANSIKAAVILEPTITVL